MPDVFVDSSVLLDVLTDDPEWGAWSRDQLEEYGERCVLMINPVIFAEVSVYFSRIEDFDRALPAAFFRREPLPWDAAFLAGKCFVRYRRNGGVRNSPLPDFFIGAHAAVRGASLLTRNVRHFRQYFPKLELIAPA